jgi:hypothetical protein
MPTLIWNGGFAGVEPVTLEENILQKNTCSTIQQQANQSVNVDSFLKTYKLLPSDNSNSNLLKRLQEFRQTIESKVKSENRSTTNILEDQKNNTTTNVKEYLNELDLNVRYLRFVNDCMTINPGKKDLDEQKEKTEESRLRYESLKTPEERVSYYEGWFPLLRPISETGLFVLFGLSLLFLFYSAALFLRMAGIQLDITLPGIVLGQTYGVSALQGKGPFIIGFFLGVLSAIVYYFFLRT